PLSVTARPLDGGLRRGRRHVVGRVLREKAVWLEHETDVRGWHHGIVLRPWKVRVAEGVPQHDVCVDQRPVLFGPARQTVAALALVRIVARSVALALLERRYPNVIVDEAGPFAPPGVLRGERERVVAGNELVANRFADGVLDVRIDDLPRPRRFQ